MGADVMRWQYCAQPPDRNLLFGFGPAHEIQRRLLTLWNSVTFLVQYGNVESFTPRLADLEGVDARARAARPLAGRARTRSSSRKRPTGYERWLTVDVVRAFEAFVDDLSNWYIRCSRRRFWNGDETALRVLWHGLAQSLRVVAPIVPFLTEHLWQVLVREPCEGAADSVFLAGWPAARDARRLRARGHGGRAAHRRPRAHCAVDLGGQAPAAAVAARGRGRDAGRRPRGDRPRRAPRQGSRARPRRVGARRQAEPARPRPEARQGARRRPCGSGGGGVRRPRRRPVPRRRPGALARRGPRRALGAGGLGDRLLGRGDRRARYLDRRGPRAGGRGSTS